MNGRWMALGAAVLMTASLASCGMSNEKTGTNRLSSQGDSGYRTSMGMKRDYLNDGHYYAQGDGTVTDYPKGQSQLDQLGKALREGWDDLMKGAEDAARDTGKAAENGLNDAKNGLKDAGQDLKQAGRDMTGK